MKTGFGQRGEVVVVGELLDPDELQAGAGAQQRGEDRRRLAGEGLLRDLQDADVLAGELGRPAEVVGARLAAPAGRRRADCRCGAGAAGGGAGVAGGSRFASSAGVAHRP